MIKIILDKKLKCFLKRVWSDIVDAISAILLFALVFVAGAALYFGTARLIYILTEKHVGEDALGLAIFGPAIIAMIIYGVCEYAMYTWNKCK